jgi:hypothetical protein
MILILLLLLFNIINSLYNGSCIEDYDCDDGIWCNGIETCDIVRYKCINGSYPCGNSKIFSKIILICNEAKRVCDINIHCFNDSDCNDNFHCNGIEKCDLIKNRCVTTTHNLCGRDEICNILSNKCVSNKELNINSNDDKTMTIWIMVLTIILEIMIFCSILFCITIYLMSII